MVLMHSISSCLPVAKVCSVATMKDSPLGRLCHQPMWVEGHGSPITARETVNPCSSFAVYQFLSNLACGIFPCISKAPTAPFVETAWADNRVLCWHGTFMLMSSVCRYLNEI